jgi:hypothetical protein
MDVGVGSAARAWSATANHGSDALAPMKARRSKGLPPDRIDVQMSIDPNYGSSAHVPVKLPLMPD